MCPAVFGSRATNLISRMGPFGGRALKTGDELPIAAMPATDRGRLHGVPLPLPVGGAQLRVMAGPQEERFTPDAYRTLFGSRYVITPASNRMGYRLEGPRLAHRRGADILSDATPLGAIQVPASGQPILLMADRQTTGGYPKIAVVITADMPIAGQLAPGDWIEFLPCSRDAAIDALKQRQQRPRSNAVSDTMALADRLRELLGDGRVQRDAPLAPLTTFKVGGVADWLDTRAHTCGDCGRLEIARAHGQRCNRARRWFECARSLTAASGDSSFASTAATSFASTIERFVPTAA